MNTRRDFIKKATLGVAAASILPTSSSGALNKNAIKTIPVAISTWNHGLEANIAAWDILQSGGKAIDAVEKGVMVTEADPENTSVGKGGAPDRDGHVTLDACIMNELNNCGSVSFLEHIVHPISVARMVMEKTDHVMLSGEGALKFAMDNGFKKENLLTKKSEESWKKWLEQSKYEPVINIENHDTIGMLAIDINGDISGACTTSGLAYKMHGRVGDSPIIGAGLYVDNEVGGACATGLGEAVIKQCGSFLIVELMRNGMSPLDACKTAIERIIKHEKNIANLQVGFLALNKQGEFGAYSIQPGFNFAIYNSDGNKLVDSDFSRR